MYPSVASIRAAALGVIDTLVFAACMVEPVLLKLFEALGLGLQSLFIEFCMVFGMVALAALVFSAFLDRRMLPLAGSQPK